MIRRPPRPSLRPFVDRVWALDGEGEVSRGAIEHVLPTGGMHLVFRVNVPLVVFDGMTRANRTVGHAVIGGARSTYYARDISTPVRSVGAMLRPGAAELLFGVSAAELAERHTRLDDVWGAVADSALDRIHDAEGSEARLSVLESILASRLPAVHGMHPVVALALERLGTSTGVNRVVRESGYSHRHFISLFRHSVGLAPKTYSRVQRFRHALRLASDGGSASLAAIAIAAGYSDQAHFNREFLDFTGVTPATYRRIRPVQPSHLAVPSNAPASM